MMETETLDQVAVVESDVVGDDVVGDVDEDMSYTDIINLDRERQKEVLLELSREYTDQEIADIIDTSVTRVRLLRKRLGIIKGGRGVLITDSESVTRSNPANRGSENFTYKIQGVLSHDEMLEKLEEVQGLVEVIGIDGDRLRYSIEISK